MIWNFTKMHGAGNDFIVLDGLNQHIDMTPARARALADRHMGIGADQILLVEQATVDDADFRYRIFNADGSEVEHCGNGARCFVRFVHDQGLSTRNPLRAQICTGVIVLDETPDRRVTVDMGSTRFDPAALPFDTTGLVSRAEGRDTLWQLPLPEVATQGASIPGSQSAPVADRSTPLSGVDAIPAPWLSLVAISNPHAVQIVDDLARAPVALLGPAIESHPRFARRVNVGFMQIIDRQTIALRVYERGAGETLACGTGACAAVAAGIRRGVLDSPVTVRTRGGPLSVSWDGETLSMTGPAVSVFSGQVDVDALTASNASEGFPQ